MGQDNSRSEAEGETVSPKLSISLTSEAAPHRLAYEH